MQPETIQQLIEAINTLGPAFLTTASKSIFISGVINLFVIAVVVLMLMFVLHALWVKIGEAQDKDVPDKEDEAFFSVAFLVVLIVTIFTFAGGVSANLSKVLAPESVFILQVMEK